jgi:RNA polymerase sigma factor (TIGR02999 family)
MCVEGLAVGRKMAAFSAAGRQGGHTAPSPPHVTELLAAWTSGDDAALAQLIPIVHAELRRLAARFMAGEQPGHTLQPSALVNEAYLRLVEIKQMSWQNRAHFFAMSGRLMRRILVDHARARGYLKRGGGALDSGTHGFARAFRALRHAV